MNIHVLKFFLYVHSTYTVMNVNICMDVLQTRLYSFTTTLHFPSGPISLDATSASQTAESQLRAGSVPSEQPSVISLLN